MTRFSAEYETDRSGEQGTHRSCVIEDTRPTMPAHHGGDRTLEWRTYANRLSGTQRRIVTTLTPTELAFGNPRTPNGATLHTVLRHAPPQ